MEESDFIEAKEDLAATEHEHDDNQQKKWVLKKLNLERLCLIDTFLCNLKK